MSGYLLSGVCYPTLQRAAESFCSQYPKHDNGVLYELTAACSTVPATNSITVPILQSSIDGKNTWNSNTETIQLNPIACDVNDMQLSPDHSFMLLVGAVIAFGLGFIGSR